MKANRSTNFFIIIFLCYLGSQFANAQSYSKSTYSLNPEEVELSLTQPGVDIVASEIVKKFLKEERIVALPNIKTKADYGIDISLEGVTAAISVDDINLINQEGFLDFLLKLKDAQIRISKLKAKRGTLFGDITITCDDINLNLAGHQGTQLSAEMVGTVQNKLIKILPQNIKYHLSENNFQVSGPRHCTGGPLEGLIKNIVNNALTKSREKIQEQVKNFIPKASTILENELSKITKQQLDFTLNFPPYLPLLNIAGSTFPQMISITSDFLSFSFAWKFKELFNPISSFQKSLPLGPWKHFGHMKIKGPLLNSILVQVLNQNRLHFAKKLNELILPQISHILTQEFFASLLPDLESLQLDSSALQGSFSIQGDSSFSLNEKSSTILFRSPQVIFTLWISQNGVIKPYFHFALDAKANVMASLNQGNLTLGYESLQSLNISGKWDENYHPKDKRFEKDDVLSILEDLKEMLAMKKPQFDIKLPLIGLGDHNYHFHEVKVKDEFLQVNISYR